MATGAESIEAVAKAMGMPVAPVFAAARALREAQSDLWPQAARGGGKNARHVEPRHLANLALALGVADPLTEAPRFVANYRALVTTELQVTDSGIGGDPNVSRVSVPSVKTGTFAPLLRQHGHTLGTRLDGLLDAIRDKSNIEMRRLFKAAGLSLTLTSGSVIEACLQFNWRMSDDPAEVFWAEREFYRLPHTTLGLLDQTAGPLLRRDVTIPFRLLEVLADLWADTIAHRERTKTKNAADLPGPTALPQDQNPAPPANTAELTGEGASLQPSPVRGPGAPQNRNRKAKP